MLPKRIAILFVFLVRHVLNINQGRIFSEYVRREMPLPACLPGWMAHNHTVNPFIRFSWFQEIPSNLLARALRVIVVLFWPSVGDWWEEGGFTPFFPKSVLSEKTFCSIGAWDSSFWNLLYEPCEPLSLPSQFGFAPTIWTFDLKSLHNQDRRLLGAEFIQE